MGLNSVGGDSSWSQNAQDFLHASVNVVVGATLGAATAALDTAPIAAATALAAKNPSVGLWMELGSVAFGVVAGGRKAYEWSRPQNEGEPFLAQAAWMSQAASYSLARTFVGVHEEVGPGRPWMIAAGTAAGAGAAVGLITRSAELGISAAVLTGAASVTYEGVTNQLAHFEEFVRDHPMP